MVMVPRFNRTALLFATVLVTAGWAGAAAADPLPGCASGAAPGQVVFTVSVSASGTPFVSTYVASAPTASVNAGCAAPSRPATTMFTVTSPNVTVYPQPPAPVDPAVSSVPSTPNTANMLQVGPYLLTVPAAPGLQVYQIAPGYYVVRSTDSTQNPTVIILPMPGIPQAPNTGPIPSVIH